EKRYIGFPVLLIPLPPSPETRLSRTLFLHAEGDENVYRVRIVGERKQVERLNLAEARARLTPLLDGPSPRPPSQAWSERLEAESQYYFALQWTASDRVSVSDLQQSEGRDVLTIRVSTRSDG